MTTALVLLVAGWSLIAAGQPKQFARAFPGRHLSAPIAMAMRTSGAVLLPAALAVLARSDSAAFATLSWVCLLSVSAMIVVLILAWLPRSALLQRSQVDTATGRRQRT